jgi:hypothetical protein
MRLPVVSLRRMLRAQQRIWDAAAQPSGDVLSAKRNVESVSTPLLLLSNGLRRAVDLDVEPAWMSWVCFAGKDRHA